MWHALSDNAARDQWFGGGTEFAAEEHVFRDNRFRADV
jgi:uncharacterized protein YndB with AHSA1/START domain